MGTVVLVFIDLKICLPEGHVHITPQFVLFISSNDNEQCRTFSVNLTHLHSIFFPWSSTPHLQWFHPHQWFKLEMILKVMTLKASLLRVAFLSKGIKTSWYHVHVHVVHAVEHEHKQSMSLWG